MPGRFPATVFTILILGMALCCPGVASGQTVINSIVSIGSAPTDVTHDPATNQVYVLDAILNVAHVYGVDLVFSHTVPTPVPSCTAIAYNSADGLVYWSHYTLTANYLYSSTPSGAQPTLIGPLDHPGAGLVIGMDFDAGGDLWICDANSSQYTSHDPTSALWDGAAPCPNPGTGATGYGITFRGNSVPGPVFEVPGWNGPGWQIMPITMTTCLTEGGSIPFPAGAGLLGIEFVPGGSTGVDAVYVIDGPAGTISEIAASTLFQRGDCDSSGVIHGLVDTLFLLNYVFVPGSQTPPCLDACDVDDMGGVTLQDGIYLINYWFLGGPPPEEPFNVCGSDPTPGAPSPGCNSSPCP